MTTVRGRAQLLPGFDTRILAVTGAGSALTGWPSSAQPLHV